MTAILRHLPFQERADEVSCGFERIAINPYQIVVRVSLTSEKVVELPPHTPRFPVILDTGHGHNFSIQVRQLTDWARLSPDQLPQRGRALVNKEAVPLHAAAVWIHPNTPGQRDQFADQPAFRLDFREGIDLHLGVSFPRLPLLGLRALVRNKLHLTVDSEQCFVHLRAPDWRTRLVRFLS